ncbi:hypothetical protein FHX42_004879 [Saccharopolyspora lacisalsi]|uniref:4-amino-4-deoxy-L-arabinose transferase-like glycosyltransferase n=1 Tax=Halosaccharopolyspora lacisalsi TaxID=1000566 RepID=A0A839E2I2_9PSEU|nr:hypothetical protein [Halosaccharopolyspora lacisalsi]MBA8827483.1 hypothetical protein [Halosaccharopolyspora lacisalsi]
MTNHPQRWTVLALLGGVALLAGAVFATIRNGLTDDAYITLDYARNLAFHGHWGIIGEEVANSATSPLNVIALTAFTAVLRQPVLALGVVFVLANVVFAYAPHESAEHSRLSPFGGLLATLLLLTNPLLLSTVGLEMTLAAALLGLLLLATVQQRRVFFGVVVGLLALTRLDLGVLVLLILIGRPSLWWEWWKWALPAGFVGLPWFVFSWFALGSAVPDSLVMKQLQDQWGEYSFANGLDLYYSVYPAATVASVSAAALGLVALPIWLVARLSRRAGPRDLHPWALFGIGGAAHFYVYTLLGVPPYHWYYASSMIGPTIFLAGAIGAVVGAYTATRLTRPLLLAAVAVAAGLGVLAAQGRFPVEHGAPWHRAPIMANWAPPSDYARVGGMVGAIGGDSAVRSPGEIGVLAYFCDCAVVDGFSDRGYLADQIEQRVSEAHPATRWLLKLNYAHFAPAEPRPVEYTLRSVEGYGPDPRWNADSPWVSPHHFDLERTGSGQG